MASTTTRKKTATAKAKPATRAKARAKKTGAKKTGTKKTAAPQTPEQIARAALAKTPAVKSLDPELVEARKAQARAWFEDLRNQICTALQRVEDDLAPEAPYADKAPGRFKRTAWERPGTTPDEPHGGGGVMSVMREGRVFEKAGVNISTVFGEFAPGFASQIPGAEEDPRFWASGISLVIHPRSPRVPTVHMNTRHIVTSRAWFGGGADLTPMLNAQRKQTHKNAKAFHAAMQKAVEAHRPGHYEDYKAWCDEYFHLKHRNEPRGIGGIFYDYLNTGDWEADFAFTQDVGRAFLEIYPKIVRRQMDEEWSEKEKQEQRVRRGRYVEFNLLWDRGTQFGIRTGGNTEAILMSLPPDVAWP